jgi:hypothetical protein
VRVTLASATRRASLFVAPVVGARLATRDVVAGTTDSTTVAACATRLPGTGARCDSDRFVEGVGPYVLPAVVGGVLALLATFAVLVCLRAFATWSRRRGATQTDERHGPSWLVDPATASPTAPSAIRTRTGLERS